MPNDQKETVAQFNAAADTVRSDISKLLSGILSNFGQGQMYGVDKLKIKVDNNGNWSASGLNSSHFTSTDGYKWSSSVSGINENTDINGDMTKALLWMLKKVYPSMKGASIYAVIQGGKCTFVAFGQNDNSNTVYSLASNMVDSSGKISYVAKWNGKTAGIAPNGLCVGTSPAVGLQKS